MLIMLVAYTGQFRRATCFIMMPPPVQRQCWLPFELWETIFQTTLGHDNSTLPSLLSVNRSWYRMVKAMPVLWTHLVLNRKHHFLNRNCAWSFLVRSKDRPLDVYINLPPDVSVNNARPVLALLRTRVPRFRTIEIHVGFHCSPHSVVSLIGGGQAAPLLEELKIGNCPRWEKECWLDAFNPSPRLTRLSVDREAFPIRGSRYATVTSLTIDSNWTCYIAANALREVRDVLVLLPQLRSFQFKRPDGGYDSNIETPDVPIVMPHLVSLDVTVQGGGVDIVRAIDAPLLTDVRWDGWPYFRFSKDTDRDNPSSLPSAFSCALLSLSKRSQLIRCLEFCWTRMRHPPEDWGWLFSGEAFPNLEVLRIRAADLGTALESPKQIRMKPGLQRLELHGCADMRAAAIMDLLEGYAFHFELMIRDCILVSQDDIAGLSRLASLV